MPQIIQKVSLFVKRNAIAFFLAFIPPIIIWYYFSRENRELTIQVISNVPVISIDQKYASDIEIRYKKESIRSLHVLDIRIFNSGNRAITRSDFDSSLVFNFHGNSITEPSIVTVRPNALKPILHTKDSLHLIIEPLLLNPGDEFVFRTFLVNRDSTLNPVTLFARIINISNIELIQASVITDQKKAPYSFASILELLTTITTSISLIYLYLKLKKSVFSFSGSSASALNKDLQSSKSGSKELNKLAEQIGIPQHDYKSALLLIRLKIESLLLSLADCADLSERERSGSVIKLARVLQSRGFMKQELISALMDIAPIINREMHYKDAYLTEKEFYAVQTLALRTVAALDEELKLHKDKRRSTNTS